LGDLLRGSALQQARSEERVPHGDRRHRVRLVQRRVHRQAPRAALRQEAERAQDRLPQRGLLVRPGRDRVGAPAREGRVQDAGGRRRVLQLPDDQRLHADHREVQAAGARRRPPHRLHQRRAALLAPGPRAELPFQGARARRRHRLRLGRLRQGARQRRQRRLRPAGARARLQARVAEARGAEDREGIPRRRAEAHGLLPVRRPSARRRRPLAAQARPRQVEDGRSGQVSRGGDVARPADRLDDQRLGREVQRERAERQRARAALHAAVAERRAGHGVAGGVHDQAGEVDPARRLGPAQIDVVAQLAVSTVLLGGIYALIAVGLTLIFGIMRVVNFAHGEFLMLGMYLAFFAFTLEGLDPYVVLLISIPIFYGVGWLVYVLIMRGVIHASHNVQIFTTVGLSTALQNVALVLWTGDFRVIRPWHSSVVLRVAGTAFNLSHVVAWAVAVALTIALFAFMKWTHTGRVMRATAQDRDAATLMGIDTDRVYRLTFAIGIACVGAAGVLVSPLYAAYPQAGLQFVTLAYVVVVLGGLGDMAGAMLGSLIVAAVAAGGSYIFGAAWTEGFYFLPFIGVLG